MIAKRNATESDLQAARERYVGKVVNPQPKDDDQSPPPYRCAGVRLDTLKRLIFDLVKEEGAPDGSKRM